MRSLQQTLKTNKLLYPINFWTRRCHFDFISQTIIHTMKTISEVIQIDIKEARSQNENEVYV